jgi:hypothetical protein
VIFGVKGDLIEGIELIYDTLMAPSLDEAGSEYGLIAEPVSYPADLSSVCFRLRASERVAPRYSWRRSCHTTRSGSRLCTAVVETSLVSWGATSLEFMARQGTSRVSLGPRGLEAAQIS